MAETIKLIAEWCAATVELLGVLIITVISIYSVYFWANQWRKREAAEKIFQNVRLRLGRGILLGLEFLVAGDIIHTVAVELTLKTVGVLAIIVLIRTFLSFALEIELTGESPWQGRNSDLRSRSPLSNGRSQ